MSMVLRCHPVSGQPVVRSFITMAVMWALELQALEIFWTFKERHDQEHMPQGVHCTLQVTLPMHRRVLKFATLMEHKEWVLDTIRCMRQVQMRIRILI